MIWRTTYDSVQNPVGTGIVFVYTSVLAYNLLFPVQLGFWRPAWVLAYNLQLRTFLHSYLQFPSAPEQICSTALTICVGMYEFCHYTNQVAKSPVMHSSGCPRHRIFRTVIYYYSVSQLVLWSRSISGKFIFRI